MFEDEMAHIEEKAAIKKKVLEKERERIKAMEKRSLHYVQQKIHEKTSWIDERKAKVKKVLVVLMVEVMVGVSMVRKW